MTSTGKPPGATLRGIFDRGAYLSVKHTSYFQVYELLFERFRGKPITFVEIGVFNGGSLFMWREYLGPQARIIGIDLNPDAQKWTEHGFEICIGDQTDPAFWDAFYSQVGPVDVVLDDGGHMNQQQIITAHKAIDHIRDGGLLIVEDVHASYLPEFGNPSDASFINWAKKMVDSMHARFPEVKSVGPEYWKKVFSVAFYESIVAFHIDSSRCFQSQWAQNAGTFTHTNDFRHASPIKTVIS